MTKVREEKRLSIKLLGTPEASIEGRPLRFGTKKSLALLCSSVSGDLGALPTRASIQPRSSPSRGFSIGSIGGQLGGSGIPKTPLQVLSGRAC